MKDKTVDHRLRAPGEPAEVHRRAVDMWTDLAFDEATLGRLRRDGIALGDARIGGPFPFAMETAGDGTTMVRVVDAITDPARIDALLDLWRVHFAAGLRPQAGAHEPARP